MRNFDRKIAAFYWGFWVFMSAVVAGPALVLGLSARRQSDQLMAVVLVAVFVPLMFLIALGAAAFLRALKRDRGVLSTLDHLRAQLSGVLVTPTVWNPFIQPRIVTTHRGRELEVRFVRMSGVQAAMHGGMWHLLVTIASQPRHRFGLITRQLLLAPRANLFGLQQADWDERLMLQAEDLNRAAMLLRDPGVFGWVQQIFSITPTAAKLQIAPVSTLNPLGTIYMGAWNTNGDPVHARAVVDAVTAIVERLHVMGEA